MLPSSVAAAKANTPHARSRYSLRTVRDVLLLVRGLPAILAALIIAHLAGYRNNLDLESEINGANTPALF